MQWAVAQTACTPADATIVRSCAVVVPTASAAEALRRTLEHLLLAPRPGTPAGSVSPMLVLPDLVTRAQLYDGLLEPRSDGPTRLSEFEREVIFRRAALEAAAGGDRAPFNVRAGLIVEILAFYDELRRRDRDVAAFERLMVGSLEPSADLDRGAERLLRLTRFLCAAFRGFERRISEAGSVDEHSLRTRLIGGTAPSGYRHVVVTVPDQSADPRGLWPADYDLLSRMPGIERLDIVATENVLAAGFHQRIHDWLPGIEEVRMGLPSPMPVLAVPGSTRDDQARWHVCRDREEELVDVARVVKSRRQDLAAPPAPLSRMGVVFQRPLPYLYLARQVFADARIPYQALDALPLAAEPFAAALDLVFSFVAGEATRASMVELLASPNWSFDVDGRRLEHHDVAAADDLLRDLKYVGGWDRLSTLAAEASNPDTSTPVRRRSSWTRAARALRSADSAAAELRGLTSAPSASGQIATLRAFVLAHETAPAPSAEWHERHMRARAAVMAALHALSDAHLRHDDEPLSLMELAGTVRRWIEGQTFAPRTGAEGLLLMDAPAAAYADLDELRLVGLVDSDWPERGRRGIFYPTSLLTQLGWPSDVDRLTAARARFQDLLRLPKARVSVSTFTLEDDAIVAPSPWLEELETAGLPLARTTTPEGRVFVHEALAEEPVMAGAITGAPAAWLAVRAARSASDHRFHGATGPRPAAAYAVSHVERYLECPFKYFAAYVLKLPEERTESSGLTPQERGQFLHDVFEAFFGEWQRGGHGAITTANLSAALALFARVADARLATLGDGDRALERTYLFGSAAAAGLAERAFAFEIEQGGDVIERLLEHSLEGEFAFQSAAGPRRIRLRAKADRIDLMADGSIRIIDYKLGRAPKQSRALQLPVYGLCAEQHLEGRHGRSWTVRGVGYLAFKEKPAFSLLGGSSLEEAMAAGEARLLSAIDGIERGDFPPQPDEPFMCTRCGYASVCRKDYIGDE